jgi:hypothetical protein
MSGFSFSFDALSLDESAAKEDTSQSACTVDNTSVAAGPLAAATGSYFPSNLPPFPSSEEEAAFALLPRAAALTLPSVPEEIMGLEMDGFTPPLKKIMDIHLPTNSPLLSLAADRDIVDGEYEGGLAVWECSLDLARYIEQNATALLGTADDDSTSTNATAAAAAPKKCLELGCGHGFPGVKLLQHSNSSIVHFSDYNTDVLTCVTHSNVALNAPEALENDRVRLYAGDWFTQIPTTTAAAAATSSKNGASSGDGGDYDIVLAAETVYTLETTLATARLFEKHLKIGGVGLIACKKYYFGCAGGGDAFREAVEKVSQGSMVITVEEKFDNGSGNIRELLKLTKI